MTSRYGVACLAALGAALLNAAAASGPGRDRNQVPDTTAAGLPAVPPQIQEDPPPVTPADDAYHYQEWVDDSHDGLYSEWWYFNVHDPFNSIRAAFSYFVTDPDDRNRNAQGRMVAVVYTPRGIVTEMDQYTIFQFSASTEKADVHIGDNTAVVDDRGHYDIKGASLDGRLYWDLHFAPRDPAWFAADRMHVGTLDWESMSWLVQMPRASVTGYLTIDGQVFAINGPGYHDHNWGEWIPTDALWNWAQFSNPRLSITVGDFVGQQEGLLSLNLDGVQTVFTKDQYRFVNTRWRWDDVNKLYYPRESHLTADNGAVRIDVRIRAWQTMPLRADLPWPLRDFIVYEQTARYEGRVWKWVPPVDPETVGTWKVSALIGGLGFKEWSWKRF